MGVDMGQKSVGENSKNTIKYSEKLGLYFLTLDWIELNQCLCYTYSETHERLSAPMGFVFMLYFLIAFGYT